MLGKFSVLCDLNSMLNTGYKLQISFNTTTVATTEAVLVGRIQLDTELFEVDLIEWDTKLWLKWEEQRLLKRFIISNCNFLASL